MAGGGFNVKCYVIGIFTHAVAVIKPRIYEM